jgi:4-amino-4-deoxy-L-arabinose transferase-like glycosyltransferase
MAAAAGGRPEGAAGSRRAYRLRRGLWLGGPLVLFALLRVPAFLEPHWYTDEAGYVTTARSLLQGQVLYSQIWTNKPPLHVWTVALVIQTLGTSEAALHVLPLLCGFATLLAIAYAGSRLVGRRRTAVALLLAAILLGLPIFDAELLLPESLLIAPLTWAGAILLTRVAAPDTRRWPLWPVGVGLLVAVAVAYQQTALAETCAFGLILALAGQASWRRVAVYAATVAGATAVWLIPAVVTAGAGRVGYALVGFWIEYAQGELNTPGQTPTQGGLVLRLTLGTVVLGVIVIAAWFHRRDRDPTWALWVWAAAALIVPALARQQYPHYIIPSIAPGVLAVSSLRLRSPAGATLSRRLAGAGLIAATAVTAAAAAVVGMDWPPILAQDGHSLGFYYGGALTTLTRGQSLTAYQVQFDVRVTEDSQVSGWISAHGLDGSSAVVWSSDAWLYDENQLQLLLPTPPIYNDEVLLGFDGPVAQRVAALQPDIVITEGESVSQWPEITSVLTAGYTEVDQAGAEAVWVRDNMVASVVGSTTGLG